MQSRGELRQRPEYRPRWRAGPYRISKRGQTSIKRGQIYFP
jgi:hypothetical protein